MTKGHYFKLISLLGCLLTASFTQANAATKKEEQAKYEQAAVPLRASFQDFNARIQNYNQRKNTHGQSIEQYNA